MAIATKTKSKKRRTKARKGGKKSVPAPLPMFRGQGDKMHTFYQCSVAQRAKAEGRKITIARRNSKTGKVEKVNVEPRTTHREDLFAKFHAGHETRAGEGKYIHNDAIDVDKNGKPVSVTGPQDVNPYLAEDGSYHTVVDVLMKNIVSKNKPAAKLVSDVQLNHKVNGDNLAWRGKRNPEGFIAGSEWFTEDELWAMCNKANPKLVSILKRAKSGRKSVKQHKSAREKFKDNFEVIRRATQIMNAATGDVKIGGGKSPYAKPLEQVQFAIDRHFLTTGIQNGEETGEYCYRLVIGRSAVSELDEKDWAYLGLNDKIAFKNESIRERVKKAKLKAA